MEVKCPKCQTIYHLDETKISYDGVTVQCTTCHNVFRVSKPSARPVDQISGWHLKRPDGTMINFAHLGELQKLILEHKAHLEDMISKDGLSYKKLADMPEFAPLFVKRNQQVEAARQVETPQQKPSSEPEPELSTPPVKSVVTPISVPHNDDEEIDIYGRPKKKGKKGGLLIAVGIVLLVIVGAAIFFLKDSIFGEKLTEDEANAVRSARSELLLSDYPNFEKAFGSLEKFTKNTEKPPKLEVLATLTHSLLLRGEMLKLENFVVEKRIKELLKMDKYSETARRLNEGFNDRQRLIQDLSNQTTTALKKLDMTFNSKPLAKYIALEYLRIQVVFDKTSADKGKEILNELKKEKDFFYQSRLKFDEGDLILKTEETRSDEGIKLIREAAEVEKGFILPYFMLARFYISKGEYENALKEINAILIQNPSNSIAKSLKEHIEDLINIVRGGKTTKPEEVVAKEGQVGPNNNMVNKEPPKAEVKETIENSKEGKIELKEKSVQMEKGQESKDKKEETVMRQRAEKTTAGEPKSGKGYAQLIKEGKQLAAKGQIDKAVDVLLRASEIEPTLADPFLTMGWIYIDAGKNEQAIGAFSRAIKLKGNRCDGYMGLGEANKFIKKNSEAKKYYQMYLEQCPNGPDAPTARNNLNSLR